MEFIKSPEKTFIDLPGMSIVASRMPSAPNELLMLLFPTATPAQRPRRRPPSEVFLEVRLALFIERPHAFLRFLGHVVVLDSLYPQEADAANVLAIGVE